MSSGLIITLLAIMGLLYILGQNFWRPLLLLFNILFQGSLGALGLYLFNLVAVYWKMEIPLNPFNALWTGFLGLPGLFSLVIIQYWIKI